MSGPHDLAWVFDRAIPEPNSGCWIWEGGQTEGYAITSVRGKSRRAHRAIYQAQRGGIPSHLVIDHLCRVTLCVNPDHMEPVTNRVNIMRGIGSAKRNTEKTHCPAGHAYAGDNLWIRRGKRHCRQCHKRHSLAANRRWNARRQTERRQAAETAKP